MGEYKIINKAGSIVDESSVKRFQASFHGKLIRPGDARYDDCRSVWNGMIDKYPAIIAYCADEADVTNAVFFARNNNLLVAVRSGGHNVAGNAVCDGGIVIDLSGLKGISVDKNSRTAVANAGLTLGELDKATQAYGLAVPVGIVSRTGMAGLTLGGGIGWLMRKYGLTCDNLIAGDIVTSEGQMLNASRKQNSDLFWGIRGGGGNFGIVTKFYFHLHPVDTVIGGLILYPGNQASEVFRFYRDYIAEIPDDLTTMLAFLTAPSPFLPGEPDKTPLLAIHACYTGNLSEGERFLKPLREFGKPLRDIINVMPYTKMQSMLDSGAPYGQQNYWKSSYLNALDDNIMEMIIEHHKRKPSSMTQIHVQHLQGAISRVHEDETAVSNRMALCVINVVSKWIDPEEAEINIRWTRDIARNLEPYTCGEYVNFMGDEGKGRVMSAYSEAHYARLVEIKNKYDPHNFFSLNQNIRPTG